MIRQVLAAFELASMTKAGANYCDFFNFDQSDLIIAEQSDHHAATEKSAPNSVN